jgi:hypothetical protein
MGDVQFWLNLCKVRDLALFSQQPANADLKHLQFQNVCKISTEISNKINNNFEKI